MHHTVRVKQRWCYRSRRCVKPVALLPSRSPRERSTRVRGAMILQGLPCPSGQGSEMVQHGLSSEGKQRYRCRADLVGRGRTLRLGVSRWRAIACEHAPERREGPERQWPARYRARVAWQAHHKKRQRPSSRGRRRWESPSSPSRARWSYGGRRRWRGGVGSASSLPRWGATSSATPLHAGEGTLLLNTPARGEPRTLINSVVPQEASRCFSS